MSEKEYVDLIKGHEGMLNHVCATYCKQYSQADLMQEILLEAWKSVNSFKNNSTFSTWLYSVARNVCVTKLRRQQQIPPLEDILLHAEYLEYNDGKDELDKQLREAMRYNCVIDSLNEPYRRWFMLYLEGLSYKEMEQRTGVDENTLRVRICRIKKQLRLRYGN